MKEILLKALKLYGLTIVAGFMCFILVFTFKAIGTSFFAEEIGYNVYRSTDGGESEKLYEHYFADGEDKLYKEYEDKGYELQKYPIPSDPPIGWRIITQVCLVFMMGIFVYNELWKLGFKDHNAVHRGTAGADKLKGLKIGAFATIPPIVLLTVLVIGKLSFAKGFTYALFALLNSYQYEAIMMIAGKPGVFETLGVWQIVGFYALLAVVPLIAHLSYTLGYKSIILSEKLVYKKNQEI